MKINLDNLKPGQRIRIKQTWYDLCPIEGTIIPGENDNPDEIKSGYGEMDLIFVQLDDGTSWTTLALNLVRDGFYHEVKVHDPTGN